MPVPRIGSTLNANDRPMLLASSWPPMATAVEQNLQREAERDADDHLLDRDDDAGGRERRDAGRAAAISGATSSATAPASTRRRRAGTNSAPNAGATMKQAPMRMNGQNSWLIHPSSWPVVSVITAAQSVRQLMSIGMLWNSSRV